MKAEIETRFERRASSSWARWSTGLAAALLVTCCSTALRAETNSELAAEIKALKEQLREMRGAIASTRRETHKVRATLARTPAPVVVPAPVPVAAIPPGATPAFVTANKGLQFGSLTISPGGYIAAESVFRTRTMQADIPSAFNAIPFGNNPLGHANEFRFSARATRPALLVEAPITPTFVVAGYMELDFQGAANTANENQSDSFNPRIRNLYATLDNADYGLHVLAGQSWTLATLNSKGITPRNEVTPPSIDQSYVPGFVYARQPGIRVTKDFGQKLWLSLAAEQSQTTFATPCVAGTNAPGTFGIAGTYANGSTLTGINCSALGTGGGFAGNTQNFSLNHVPDVIAKAAYESRIGERDIHSEVFGMYRNFYDRVAYTDGLGFPQNNNRNTTGWGVGAGLIVPVIPRRLDFQVSGLYGRGIGRYGSGQLADTTFNADGSLKPIQEGMLLGGVVVHATPAIDVYAFSGIEKEFRTYSQNSTGTFFGQGGPFNGTSNISIQGCNMEPNLTAAQNFGCPSTAAGNTKQLFQVTGGMWDKLYKGSFGEVRVGVQYQFTERQVFNNLLGGTTTPAGQPGYAITPNSYQPKTFSHTIFTSLRYYPFL